MSSKVNLLPWEPRVSKGHQCIEVTIAGDHAVVQPLDGESSAHPIGWFAAYEDKFFGVFQSPDFNDFRPVLLIGNAVWPLAQDSQLSSSRSLVQRSFTITDARGSANLRYQRLWWNLFHKPGTALSQIVFADDWWGVVCDLPGWVASRWSAGRLADEMTESLGTRGAENSSA
jgi:hypothetical protein